MSGVSETLKKSKNRETALVALRENLPHSRVFLRRSATGVSKVSGDCRKMTVQGAPDFRSSSRSDNRRIPGLCHCWRDTEDERKDQQAGLSLDRNRLSRTHFETGFEVDLNLNAGQNRGLRGQHGRRIVRIALGR
jgi:hypothetical protein